MLRPFSPADRDAILERDGGCLGPRVGMAGECQGRLEVDHILNAGLGIKGPPTQENGATLCTRHHRTKTESARYWRPILVQQVRMLMGLVPLEGVALRGCVGKRVYATRTEAKRAARQVQQRLGRMVPYRCPACGELHIGHDEGAA